jgi:hypothetical protein
MGRNVPRPDTRDIGPGPVPPLRQRAAPAQGSGGRADPRRRRNNADAAPVFPERKRKPGAGPALQLVNEETVPPRRKGP